MLLYRGSHWECTDGERKSLTEFIAVVSGDELIDSPPSIHPVLAGLAIALNDSICTHTDECKALCYQCADVLFTYDLRLFSTAVPSGPEGRRLTLSLVHAMQSFIPTLDEVWGVIGNYLETGFVPPLS